MRSFRCIVRLNAGKVSALRTLPFPIASSIRFITSNEKSNPSHTNNNDEESKKEEISSSSTVNKNEDHLNMPASMKKTAETIGTATLHATHELNKVYHDLEQQLMSRINESNTKRFRMIVLGTILAIVWIVSVFGKPIRAHVAKGTADLAKETLEDESFKIQTQELARAIVQTILNDKDVTSQAALFLHTASAEPETQQALLALTLHVLQHPDSIIELGKLLGEVIKKLSVDKQTTDSLAILLANALQDAAVYSSLVHVLGVMGNDPAVSRAFSSLLAKICADEQVKMAVQTLIKVSAEDILEDTHVAAHSREFAAKVLGDDDLQREGGHAIWNSVSHALKPGVQRVTGFWLVVFCVGAARVLLSPF